MPKRKSTTPLTRDQETNKSTNEENQDVVEDDKARTSVIQEEQEEQQQPLNSEPERKETEIEQKIKFKKSDEEEEEGLFNGHEELALLDHAAEQYTRTKIVNATRVYRSRKAIENNCFHYYFIDDDTLEDEKANHFCLFLNSKVDGYKVEELGICLNHFLEFNEENSNLFLNDLKEKIENKNIEITYKILTKGNVIISLKFVQ